MGSWVVKNLVRRLKSIPPLLSTSDQDFEWPSEAETQAEQESNSRQRTQGTRKIEGLHCNQNGAVWILSESEMLQLRLCIIGHTSAAGHRDAKSTETEIRKHYFWRTMEKDIRSFVAQCIHCISTTRGIRYPRLFGTSFHGTKANDLLQLDYLVMISSSNRIKYLLLMRDDFSSYVWLFPFEAPNIENAAEAILKWSIAFTPPSALISDWGSHFQNETIRLVVRGLKTKHHFNLPYTLWSNGGESA